MRIRHQKNPTLLNHNDMIHTKYIITNLQRTLFPVLKKQQLVETGWGSKVAHVHVHVGVFKGNEDGSNFKIFWEVKLYRQKAGWEINTQETNADTEITGARSIPSDVFGGDLDHFHLDY